MYRTLKKELELKLKLNEIISILCMFIPILEVLLLIPLLNTEELIIKKIITPNTYLYELVGNNVIYINTVWFISVTVGLFCIFWSMKYFIMESHLRQYIKNYPEIDRYIPKDTDNALIYLLELLKFNPYDIYIYSQLFTYTTIEDYFNVIYSIVHDEEIIKKSSKIRAVTESTSFEKISESDKRSLLTTSIADLLIEINNKYNLASVIKFNTDSTIFVEKYFQYSWDVSIINFKNYINSKGLEKLFEDKELLVEIINDYSSSKNKIKDFMFSEYDLKILKDNQKLILDKLKKELI